jgi:hypothetical protein
MKNLLLFVSIALILFSCDDSPMEEEVNPFVGTWERID